MLDEIYSIKEVSVLLGVTPDSVRKYVREGRLKAYVHRGQKNRKELRVLESDLKTFTFLNFLEPYYPGHRKPGHLPKNILQSVNSFEKKEDAENER